MATVFELAGLRFDFSRQHFARESVNKTITYLQAQGLESARVGLLSGAIINTTERRAAWHTVLRLPADQQPVQVAADLSQARKLAQGMIDGSVQLPGGKIIKHVIVLGIGGSLLGPQVLAHALLPKQAQFDMHFIGNIDGHVLSDVFARCDPNHTLFILISKSFTTLETQINAQHCLRWLHESGASNVAEDGKQHFVAITANRPAAAAWGARADWTLGFEDWVGGRYSVWSAVSFPVMLACGVAATDQVRAGAYEVDQHFLNAALASNIPVLMACAELAALERGEGSRCVAAYDERLAKLPDYLQQLEMESLGKRVQQNGQAAVAAGPLVWGTVGTTGQHSVFQWLHQGLQKTPIDFIVCAKPDHSFETLHRGMLANCLAQAQALDLGRDENSTRSVLSAQGLEQSEVDRLAPHMTFMGGRRSSLIMFERLNPYSLGALLALYEHKVFVLSLAFGSNAFDQYGVELGKIAAKRIDAALLAEGELEAMDGVDQCTTAQLLWLKSV